MAASVRAQALRDAGYQPVSHGPAYVPPMGGFGAGVPMPVVPVATPQRQFPVGAIVLIALGILFSLANFDMGLHVSGRWLLPVVLAGVSIWTFTRRLKVLGHPSAQPGAGPWYGAHILGLRWPVMLMVLAILFFLQALDVFTLGQTWPVLVIALGAMLLVERAGQSTGAAATYAATPPVSSAAASKQPTTGPDSWPKGGQA